MDNSFITPEGHEKFMAKGRVAPLRKLEKHWTAVALAATLALLAGCGGGTNATDKAVSVAEQAIEVADSYLDGDMSYDEAKEKLADLEDDMEYAKDMPKDTAEEIKQQSADYSISADISMLSIEIMSDNIDNSSDSYDKVVEARNELAADAGLEKR